MRWLIVLIMGFLLSYLIARKIKKKGLATFFITYIFATIIRTFTGISFNLFYNKFHMITFMKDIVIWVFSYGLASLFIAKFNKE